MLRRRCERTDVLVLGSGMAAACAVRAIRDADPDLHVTVATRGAVLDGGSSVNNPRGHVRIQAPGLLEADPADAGMLALEIHNGGGFIDAALATLLARRIGPVLRNWMDRHKLEFLTRHNDRPLVTAADFSSGERAWHISLADLRRSLSATWYDDGLAMLEHHRAVTLLTDGDPSTGGRCIGALLLDFDTGDLVEMRARATVLATGGAAGVFALTLAHETLLGDGWSLADDLGVPTANCEFTTFVLAGLLSDQHEMHVLPVERFRKDSLHALVMNTARQDLMEQAVPDLIDRARAFRLRSGYTFVTGASEGVRLDLAILRANRRHSDPGRPCVRVSFDGGPVYTEVAHRAWTTNGGVLIDKRAATTVPGLFAAGEVTTGMTGAQPPGGTRMAASLVFGEIAGQSAVEFAGASGDGPADDFVPPQVEELHDNPDAPPADPTLLGQIRLFASSRLPLVPDENLKALFLLQRKPWSAPLAETFANPDPTSRQAACDNHRAYRALQLMVRATLKRTESCGPVVLHEPLEPEPLAHHEIFEVDGDARVIEISDEEVAELDDDE